MTGRLSKLRRRQDDAPSPGPIPAQAPPADDQPTAVQPPVTLFADAPTPALPADVAPGAADLPSFRDRGQFRRRLRYLRRVRELGFRDLGGLVFDLHRFQQPGDALIAGKLAALDAVDRELRALERVMRDEREFTDLREPGIAACARCGALHGSDARFCPSCGISLTGPRTLSELPVAPAVPTTAPVATAATPLTWDAGAAAVANVPLATAAAPPADEAFTQAIPVVEPEPAAPAPLEPEAASANTPEPEAATPATAPEPAGEPEAEAAPGESTVPEVSVSAAESGSQPVSAAALGLPVPPPPPVPPLRRDHQDQPTTVMPRVDADESTPSDA